MSRICVLPLGMFLLFFINCQPFQIAVSLDQSSFQMIGEVTKEGGVLCSAQVCLSFPPGAVQQKVIVEGRILPANGQKTVGDIFQLQANSTVFFEDVTLSIQVPVSLQSTLLQIGARNGAEWSILKSSKGLVNSMISTKIRQLTIFSLLGVEHCLPRCASSEFCVGPVCRVPPSCKENVDCKEEGTVCLGSRCISKPPSCESSADCPLAGLVCFRGFCVPQPSPCQADQDCEGDGQICLGNQCLPQPLECSQDLDCQSIEGTVCISKWCLPKPLRCEKDSECNERDTLCLAGMCLPEPRSCEGQSDCSKGELCFSGACTVEPQPCAGHSECKLTNYLCFSGVCVPKPSSCDVHRDCRRSGFICIAGKCLPAPPACQKNEDCQQGALCRQGLCLL